MNCGFVFGSRKKFNFPAIQWKLLNRYPYQYMVGDWENCPNLTRAFWECLPRHERETSTLYHPIGIQTFRKMRKEYELFLYDWEDGDWKRLKRSLRHIERKMLRLAIWQHLYPNDIKVIFYCSERGFEE